MEKIHVFLLKIEKSKIDKIEENINKIYPKSTNSVSLKSTTYSKILYKIPSYENKDVIFSKIELLSGVISIEKQPLEKIRSTSTNYSTVLMAGLGIFMVSIIVATFLIPENPIESLTKSQMLLIQVSIALAISIWIFFYDKKSQEDIVRVVSNINKTVNETNQTVKDLQS
ncbi:hypothetical protein [Candidatus Nitrosopumilus sediminis]|uniref:Uncharacterized protein n=1 Tax=Candidatus Nitrosopumilus sediminis TaxID=1229909 RepID=K0BCD9_9ARCH|nr:hypothetical protein [Candidatus Nitrosopumilus sediminis]AFS83144.1 hypothetical protein NSED_06730 [Candidatus Nitrosopumilus sediminis]